MDCYIVWYRIGDEGIDRVRGVSINWKRAERMASNLKLWLKAIEKQKEVTVLNARHLAKCNPSSSPKVPPCLCGHVSTSLTQMKRHRRTCEVWQNRDKDAVAKARRKQTNIDLYGVVHSAQTPEVQARRKKTNTERFGAENPFCKDSTIFDKVQESLEGKRPILKGADNPFAWESTKEKIKATMLEKHGVENPQQVPSIKARTMETFMDLYGGVFMDSEVLQEKAKETWQEKYGVDNPSKADEVKARIKEVWMENYGVPFPPNSLWTNQTMSFPNKLEQKVDALSPDCLVYSGDGSYWVRCAGVLKARNPDFVLLNPKQLQAYQNGVDLNLLRTYMVVEVFGDYWHGPERTGKSREAHKAEVIEYYEKCGIRCLVLWESEVKADPKDTAQRLFEFIYQ